MTTDVFLDVDGVLNACPGGEPNWLTKWGWSEHRWEHIWLGMGRYKIRWSPGLIERVNALAEEPNVRVHWLTTWREWAPEYLPDLMGIKGADWPVLGMKPTDPDDLMNAGGWWKLAEVHRHVSANPENRFIWIDDDLKIEKAAQQWISATNAGRPDQVLGISPDTRYGITPHLMEQIEEFAHAED